MSDNVSEREAISEALSACAEQLATNAWPSGLCLIDALSRTERAALQLGLEAVGLYAGIIDGRWGSATNAAVLAFAVAADVPINDPSLLPAGYARALARAVRQGWRADGNDLRRLSVHHRRRVMA